MKARTLSAALLLLAGTTVHAAQIYRCTEADGVIEYRDTPCARTEPGGPVKIEPNTTPGIDPNVVRSETNAIAERAAARAAADEQAARARAQARAKHDDAAQYSVPWWMLPGPPPERAGGQNFNTGSAAPSSGKR